MAILNISTTNAQITDEKIKALNSNPLTLYRSTFYNKAGKLVVIRTAAGGGGTLLTEGTDYVINGEINVGNIPVDSSGQPITGSDSVWSDIAIVNATYQNIDLFVSYWPIGDIISAETLNRELPNVIETSSNISLIGTEYPDGEYRVANTKNGHIEVTWSTYKERCIVMENKCAVFIKASGVLYPVNAERPTKQIFDWEDFDAPPWGHICDGNTTLSGSLAEDIWGSNYPNRKGTVAKMRGTQVINGRTKGKWQDPGHIDEDEIQGFDKEIRRKDSTGIYTYPVAGWNEGTNPRTLNFLGYQTSKASNRFIANLDADNGHGTPRTNSNETHDTNYYTTMIVQDMWAVK